MSEEPQVDASELQDVLPRLFEDAGIRSDATFIGSSSVF